MTSGRQPNRWPAALGSLGLAVVVVGCSAVKPAPSSGSSSTSPVSAATSPAATLPPETPWQHELDNLQPDGNRSLDSALRLFAMAFGPVPGVDVTPAAPGSIDSASPAVRVVREHLAELSPAQRQAIEAYLDVPDDQAPLAVPAASPGASWMRGGPLAMIQIAYAYTDFRTEVQDESTRAYDQASTYFGPMPLLYVRLRPLGATGVITYYEPHVGATGVYGCDIIVNTDTANLDRFATRRGITLDTVHCLQSQAMGSDAGQQGDVPAWAWEGPAEYILREIWPPVSGDAQAWPRYLLQPELPLFERSYDAIGYYAQARAAGLDLASVFTKVLTDGDSPGRFDAAGTTSEAFLGVWASQLARTGWNDRWIFDGPGIPGSEADTPRQPLSVSAGSLEAVNEAAYANQVYGVQSVADVMEVDIVGHARIGDGIEDTTALAPAYFCTTEKGCGTCPDGSEPSIQRVALRSNSILAVSGGTDGTNGTVSGHDLEEFCKASPPPTAVQVRNIQSIGGHQVTFADLLSCDGPYGHWTGLFYGLGDIMSRTMDFDMGGGPDGTSITTTPGAATTDKNILTVSGDVQVTIQDNATTMILSGTTDVVFRGPNGPLPPDHHPFSVAYQITPADPGRCP